MSYKLFFNKATKKLDFSSNVVSNECSVLFETYEDIDGNTQIGIPISSLHKFDTISVATIDGGIEPYIS